MMPLHNSAASPLLLVALLGGLLLAGSLGCSSHSKRLRTSRQDFYSNNLPAAHRSLTELSQGIRSDHTVAELDLALIELFQGQPASAELRLRQVRDQWYEAEQQVLADEAQALLTDDQRRAYSGDVHEKLLIGVFLALASLMHDGSDAESYTLQTLMKQQQFVEQATADNQTEVPDLLGIPPLAPYLRGMLREATLHDYDDAARMYQLTAALLPQHPQVAQDIQRAAYGNHSQPGHGVVYVIALVGRGPYKEETTAPVTQAVMLQADQLFSIFGKYSVPPTLAPIKVPELVCPPKQFDLIGVQVNGQPISTTLPMTDIRHIAQNTFQAQLPKLMARTVARRIAKKGAVYAVKSQMQANQLASIAMDVAGVAWEATESADTRSWGLLPGEIQLLRLELPVGKHQVTLEPTTAGRPVAAAKTCYVEVLDACNSYVMGYWPDRQLIGQLLVNCPALVR
ncbi:MAG: hypothetical protein KF752_00305 [Pirellulaceae bacterium]|nr:hypothetical protein [Pirellulaceae bacterium]